jgi:hypothetical protein
LPVTEYLLDILPLSVRNHPILDNTAEVSEKQKTAHRRFFLATRVSEETIRRSR